MACRVALVAADQKLQDKQQVVVVDGDGWQRRMALLNGSGSESGSGSDAPTER